MSTTDAEVDGYSSAIYRSRMANSELKVLIKI